MRKCREKRGEAGKEKRTAEPSVGEGAGQGAACGSPLGEAQRERRKPFPCPAPADYRKNFRRRLSFKGGEMAIISRVSPRMKNTARG